MRTKHAKKYRVDLEGQSLILKAAEADCRGLGKGYLQRVLINEKLSEVSLYEIP